MAQRHFPPVAYVLVVDDESAVRRFAARVLSGAGFAVYEAADGREALAVIESAPEPIDLLVTDIVMPGLNGVELLRQLATTHPAIPVLLMSAYTPQDLLQMGIAAPPCGILPKPFASGELLGLVRHCIGRTLRQGA